MLHTLAPRTRRQPAAAFITLLATLATLLALLALQACTQVPPAGPPAALVVDPVASSLRFVSTKAGSTGVGGVVEVHRFDRFQGGLDADGQVRLTIDLASVSTGVPIRDERLRTLLFNVAAHPQATFTARIDTARVAALPADATLDLELVGQFTLAGQTRTLPATLRVTRLSAGALKVSTLAPIVVDAPAFGLKPGVEALREVMGLAFLAAAVPVTLDLVLHPSR